jgi:hypothetical protein
MRVMTLAMAVMLIPGTAANAQDSAFFNGKDLAGWHGLEKYWSVKDGAIVGSSYPSGLGFNTFLCSKRPYRDFELSFKVQLKGGGHANSGVQIRSAVFNLSTLAVMGPQCDMGQIYWGSLYGEHFGGMMKQAPTEVVKKVLRPEEYNDYSIRCVGKRVTIKLNGETTVDQEFPNLPEIGLIAWQLHSSQQPMEVTFKDIQFAEIKEAKKN